MSPHLIQAILFSFWAVLMLRLFRRALKMHRRVQAKQRPVFEPPSAASDEPMAIKVDTLHF